MGQSLCAKQSKNLSSEITTSAQFLIKGPPKMIQPTPIFSLNIKEDSPVLEKEEFEVSLTQNEKIAEQNTFQHQQSDDLHQNPKDADQCWIKKEKDSEEVIFPEASKKDINNSSGSNNLVSSNQQIHVKSILKIKIQNKNGSSPTSPKPLYQQQQSIGSQRSIKKVTFDKKSKVVYSSFRKPKT